MPEDNNPTTNPMPSSAPAPQYAPSSEEVSMPISSTSDAPAATKADSVSEIRSEVIGKINNAHNVLIALSSDPSVDEMAAAIGLSLYLDKLGKRATAIYSGATPNALEFLKPEDAFEPSADSLQDFVIALNKDKADHLRYRLDGDYVKIYITPYRTRIDQDDLDFSYGDYNVDLVLALDIANGIDLDSALREHGRIMHDAVIINITTGNPGKFGEIEWSDKKASSISEMIAKLLYNSSNETKLGKEEATAFLTGIVAATNRFSNAKTTPDTMKVSSSLMESGANQQLISKNITPDVENELFASSTPSLAELDSEESKEEDKDKDPTNLSISHIDDDKSEDDVKPENNTDDSEDVTQKSDYGSQPEPSATATSDNGSLLDDLKAAEANLAQAGSETTPDTETSAVKIENPANTEASSGSTSESTPGPISDAATSTNTEESTAEETSLAE